MNWATCRRCGAEYDYELCANAADLCPSCLMDADRFINERNQRLNEAESNHANSKTGK